MIQFIFTGNPYPSFEEQDKAKKNIIEKLGPLKEEFEQKGGIITFNYSNVDEDGADVNYVLSEPYTSEQADFTRRWNEYIQGLQK